MCDLAGLQADEIREKSNFRSRINVRVLLELKADQTRLARDFVSVIRAQSPNLACLPCASEWTQFQHRTTRSGFMVSGSLRHSDH